MDVHLLREGISLVLARWTALQLAVANEWGGKSTHLKYDRLHLSIFKWLKSKSPKKQKLEKFLDDFLSKLFNTFVEDGSIDEVAEKLRTMYAEFQRGNYRSLEKLRSAYYGEEPTAVSLSQKVDSDDDDESSDDDAASEDEQVPKLNSKLASMEVDDEQKPTETMGLVCDPMQVEAGLQTSS